MAEALHSAEEAPSQVSDTTAVPYSVVNAQPLPVTVYLWLALCWSYPACLLLFGSLHVKPPEAIAEC